MARGESPYQGRYVVPQVDFSPIAQGGRDIGAALSSIGGSIGSAVVKRKELKGKLDTYSKMIKGMEADVELYLDADPEERKRVASMIKELDQETRADPSKNLIQKVAAYEAALPILKSRLDSSFRERRFKEEKRRTGLMYPPLPTLGRPPTTPSSGTSTPTPPDPSSPIPTTPPPQVPDPSSLISATPPSATEPDLDTLNELTPDPQSVPPVGLTEPTPLDTQPQPVPEGEIGSWEEFDKAGEELDRLQRKKAIPDIPDGYDSWEEYQNVQQMDLWDEGEGEEGGKGVRGATFSQPLLTPDESISRELANRAGISIPTKSLREPPPLTDDEEYKLNQLQTDPRFLAHPQGARAYGTMLATLQAKQKAHREFPQNQIEHWTKLVNLSGALFEMDRESKMPDLSDSKIRAQHIKEQGDVYDALGMDATFSWSGGKLAVSIKDVEDAKDMIPLRYKKADGTYEPVPGMYHIEGSSVLHIMDAATGTLVKPASSEEASNIAFNNVRIWKTVMENIWNTEPVSDIGQMGGVLGESRSIPINFANLDSMLGTIMRSVTTDEEFTRKNFGEKLIKGDFNEGGRREKGWEIKDGVLEYWTKRGDDAVNWQIPIDASFKTGVDEWVKYHNAKKGIAGITTAIQLQGGQRGGKGDEGIRGETGIPEFPYRPTEAPLRSYNRQEILEQIRN